MRKKIELNSLIKVRVTELGYKSEARGLFEEIPVFIKGGVPGDILTAKVEHRGPNGIWCSVKDILTPSPHRLSCSPCAHADRCGCCAWINASYKYQLQGKRDFLLTHLSQAKNFSKDLLQPIKHLQGKNLRTKIQMVISGKKGQMTPGFYYPRTHNFVEVKHCPAQNIKGEQAIFQVLRLLNQLGLSGYNEKQHKGTIRHLLARVSGKSNRILVTIVCRHPHRKLLAEQRWEKVLKTGGVSGICLNINSYNDNRVLGSENIHVAGSKTMVETIIGLKFRLGPTSFFQTNYQGAQLLLTEIQQLIPDGINCALDLYAGLGPLAAIIAERSNQVVAIEASPQSVNDGIASLNLNRIKNISFINSDVEQTLQAKHFDDVDLVTLNPPRAGCGERVVHLLCDKIAPQRIIYVSCNPASLVKDLQILCHQNYKIHQVIPIDMFPNTPHLETIVELRAPSKITS